MDKIKDVAQRLGIITVEDMERYTALELIMMIANKMNEFQEIINDYSDELQNLSDKIQYLLNEGTLAEVEQIFNEWTQDGTFDTLINQYALKEVNDRLDETSAQLSQISSQKLDKSGIVTMANMGQDVKEAMTGGSVPMVGRDAVLNSNIVDNQIGIEKLNFANYDGQKIVGGKFYSNKYLNKHDDGFLYSENITSGNAGFYYEIPIEPESTIRIKARGINKCRIGIAFKNDIINGEIVRASKVIVNDDTLTDYDTEFSSTSGLYLIAYIGSNLTDQPVFEVKTRDSNAKIKFKSPLDISASDINFLKQNPIKKIANNFVVSAFNGGYALYRKDSLSESELKSKKYVTLFIDPSMYESIDIKFRGNRGYLRSSSEFTVDDYLSSHFDEVAITNPDGDKYLSWSSDEVTIINDSREVKDCEYKYVFNGTDKALVLYISSNTDDYSINIEGFNHDEYSLIGDSVKMVADFLHPNTPINGNNIIEKSIPKSALNFDISSNSSPSAVNIPFWEVPQQPNTWATTPSGKDLNINSEQFMDLFFNPYVGVNYDDGYKVTKTILGKDTSNTYNIYEYIFEPKNYTRTIIITSGNHPYELPAHFGFGRLIHYIMNEPDVHEGIKYLRDNVRIVTIPVINPWGFSQNPKVYGNSNLVNINRNFDSNQRWYEFPTSEGNEWNYKGTEPFSEKETQILRDFYIKYKDVAEWAIDCHCGVGNEFCDAWIVGLSGEDVLLPKVYKAIDMFDERCRNVLKREPVNKMQLDMDSSIRCWYSVEQLGLPNISVEYRPQQYGGDMNGSIDLTYYLMYLSNYIFQALSFSNDEIRHNQILLFRKIDNLLKNL